MSAHSARAALDAARGIFAASDRHTAPQLWQSAQGVLQSVIGRPELTGQALVSEVRQLGLINLADAHALVALAAWADRSTGLAENEAERILVREAWMALEHAIPEAPISSYASAYGSAPAGTPPTSAAQPSWAPGANASAGATFGSPAAASSAPPPFVGADDHRPRRRWLWPAVGAGVLLVALGGVAAWWFTTGKPERELADAVTAYQRGSREVARSTFARLAMERPDDARPLIYLGRITREDGDLGRARTFLTNAVRLAPESAVAARELAGIMLADGQPEIARRFYVRAIQLDPEDRMAQGFLGCALVRLGRFDEAPRWIQRAGPGEWQQCLASMPAPPVMPSPYPISPRR
ncbi:MAG TPA: tetratricopeptide repeat protein [Gemmatimonas sp.]|uniref:tetratricopeptide repeat protein n=1 Tax=Gemmatimonas sp. TaxID=1962908 RepID=UPI002ED78B0D